MNNGTYGYWQFNPYQMCLKYEFKKCENTKKLNNNTMYITYIPHFLLTLSPKPTFYSPSVYSKIQPKSNDLSCSNMQGQVSKSLVYTCIYWQKMFGICRSSPKQSGLHKMPSVKVSTIPYKKKGCGNQSASKWLGMGNNLTQCVFF